ncbi:uncharacterized protein LOC116942856 [Petromyzon marinus]|uniref:uncharacterized protein LOC116942856 n=1 Tax=Petromyzon marinus TaxID=7757 RepID=UPI003F71310D
MAWTHLLFVCIVQFAAGSVSDAKANNTAVIGVAPNETTTPTSSSSIAAPGSIPTANRSLSATQNATTFSGNASTTTTTATNASTTTVASPISTSTINCPTSTARSRAATVAASPLPNTRVIAGSAAAVVLLLLLVTGMYMCFRSRRYNSFWFPRGMDSELGMNEINRKDADAMSSTSSESSVYSPAEIAEIAARANELDLSRKALHTETDSNKDHREMATENDGEDAHPSGGNDIVENGTDNGSSDATTHLIEQDSEVDGAVVHP